MIIAGRYPYLFSRLDSHVFLKLGHLNDISTKYAR